MLAALLLPVAGIVAVNLWVAASMDSRMFEVDGAVPARETALVLGTSKKRVGGRPNLHFERRMDAAAALYAQGKVQTLLVSGARNGPYYNEPRDMAEALKARGVPESAVMCDYAGYRTLDSVVRARDRLGLRQCLIVSDDWHVPRALLIARAHGLDAIGVGAKDIDWKDSFKARTREWLARVLVMLDLYALKTQPMDPEQPIVPATQPAPPLAR